MGNVPAFARQASVARPATGDDRRLEGWYHTIDLGDGRVTGGIYDHRSLVDRYGLPQSLAGKTALDVGTSDGFWAFELERRGATRVCATDIATNEDLDMLPAVREALGERAKLPNGERFEFAHAELGSRVERTICNIYDLSPETVGTFDVVFCGDVLLHLFDPLRALLAIRSVTREMAIVCTLLDEQIDEELAEKPVLSFGRRAGEQQLGESCIYWRFSTRGLEEMMQYAGFARTEALPAFQLPPYDNWQMVVRGYP